MCYTNKKAFTLIEILIALFLSSIIMVGLFELFNSVLNAKVFSETKQNRTEMIYKIVSLISRDIRCKVGSFSTGSYNGRKVLRFSTTDSILFGGSRIVRVAYYLKEFNGKLYLVREESNKSAREDLIIPLTNIFRRFDYKFYYGGEWTNRVSQIIRIYLYTKNNKISFVCGGIQ